MPLNVGSRLGHYDVTALIGEGGMGQVYQATDTKLKRQVALKILPEAFSADPERLARFQREAEVLASLNHPNIGHIYGLARRAEAAVAGGPNLSNGFAYLEPVSETASSTACFSRFRAMLRMFGMPWLPS